LKPSPSRIVKPPRVEGALAALECKVTEILQPKGLDGKTGERFVVFGEVVGIHIDEAVMTDGLFDIVKAGTVSRLGYMDYAAVTETFQMRRPLWDDAKPTKAG